MHTILITAAVTAGVGLLAIKFVAAITGWVQRNTTAQSVQSRLPPGLPSVYPCQYSPRHP
jgi:hypothetical protein